MKKVLSKTLIIGGSIVLALGITILVLSLIKIKPVEALDGYKRVEIYDLASSDRQAALTDDEQKTFNEGLNGVNFSVMQGILEGKVSGKLNFKEENEERIEYTEAEIEGVVATASAYKLEFIFSDVKTVNVEGEEIKYDRAIVLVGDSNNEIGTLEIVFYEYAMIGNEADEEAGSSEYYKTYPVTVNAKTTKLFNTIADIIDARN